MIDVASRAKSGVKIPGKENTRAEIIQLFNDHLAHLQETLNVRTRLAFLSLEDEPNDSFLPYLQSPRVVGKVSVTTDAWTAGNGDGYCTVTAHWIEETAPTNFELKNAIIGFVSVPRSHTGKRLGQVVYKVLARIGIDHKACRLPISFFLFFTDPLFQVGWVTSDNAANNDKMMVELARCLEGKMPEFDPLENRIRYVSPFFQS